MLMNGSEYFDVISAVKDEIRIAQYRVVPTESF